MGLPQPVRSRRTMRLKSSTTTTTTSSSRQHTCRCGSQHVHHNVSSRLAQYHNALRSEVTPAAASSTCWPAQERSVHVAAAASSDVPAAAATSKPEGRGFKELYLHANVHPGPFVGPIAVANIPGKGRGLIATEVLSPGQLLLVVPPLALVESNMGDIPEHDEIVELLTSSGATFSPYQAAWLKALTTTTAADDAEAAAAHTQAGSKPTQQQHQQPLVPDFLPPSSEQYPHIYMGDVRPQPAADPDRVSFRALQMDEQELWAAVVLNCYGEGFQDLPASMCASADLSSQLGLWGPFSLLNHTCCPNAVNYTLRDCMMVRACAPVAPGEELTINYLGRSALTPLSQRQEELEACYGFKCGCRRCRAEERWAQVSTQAGVSLDTFLDQLHSRIGGDWEPRKSQILYDLQEASDAAQQQEQELQQLVSEMQQQWAMLQAAAGSVSNSSSGSAFISEAQAASGSATGGAAGSTVGSISMHSQTEEASWVLASAFDLLGMLHDSAQASGRHEAAVLDAIVQVCEAVCPGSDLHVFQALVRVSLVQQQEKDAGAESAAADEAMRALVRALHVRYGPRVEDEDLLPKMIAATSRAANMVWL